MRKRWRALLALVGLVLAIVSVLLWLGRRDGAKPSAHEPMERETPAPATVLSEPASSGRSSTAGAEQPQGSEQTAKNKQPKKPGHLAPRADQGMLLVHVTSSETGQPLEGVGLFLMPASHPVDMADMGVSGTRRSEPFLWTDVSGNAEYPIKEEVACELWVNFPPRRDCSQLKVPVAELRAGETRALEVKIRSVFDRHVYGRVIDGETLAPLAGATIFVLTNSTVFVERDQRTGELRQERWRQNSSLAYTDKLTADSDGRFDVVSGSWRTMDLMIEMTGYARQRAALGPNCDTPQRPLVVRLFRGASLEMHVSNGAAANNDLVVRASTHAQALGWDPTVIADEDTEWRGTVKDGLAVLGGLPARAALSFELRRNDRILRREDGLTLEPGERRRIVWTLGPGASIDGVVLASEGKPVSGVEAG